MFALIGPGGSVLPAISVGRGTTYAVLLHQTNRPASCGWWPYANWLATTRGVHAVLFDLCNYGQAVCRDEGFAQDQVAQARLGVDWARAHGARRVVVVGASMGGAIALDAAVAAKADAVVDLSGPSEWPPLSAARTAPRLTMPTLIAIRPGDLGTSYEDLKAAFARIPAAHKKFVTAGNGHGWDLLNDYRNGTEIVWLPMADEVADWIAGRYT
ncbi:MAG TPA: alpha/beta fold hydrolase [Candidatus Eisenbacteria bacterium]|nr:alpha/beta fold hydrolase [Candidatus Eisenbacteria bacterium]